MYCVDDSFVGDLLILIYLLLHLTREQILRVKGDDLIPMVLVGNKADLASSSRRVKEVEAQEQAAAWGIEYIETSAKTYSNVDAAFQKLLVQIHNRKKASMQANNTKNKAKKSKKKKKCTIL